VAVNFIQRWNYHREALQSPHPYLIPITKSLVPTGTANCQVVLREAVWSRFKSINCATQIVRSIGDWSGSVGPLNTETSIYKSYLHYIENAQHYIYIGFSFIVLIYSHNNLTRVYRKPILHQLTCWRPSQKSNCIGFAQQTQKVKQQTVRCLFLFTYLLSKHRAIQNQEMFRIVVLLPVHPDGTFKDSASTRWIMK